MGIIFLTYVNRSGSTYLANLLSKSEEICVCPEANILVELLLVDPAKRMTTKDINSIRKRFIENSQYKNWGITSQWMDSLNTQQLKFDCFLMLLKEFCKKKNARYILFKSERLAELYDKLNRLGSENCPIKWISLIRDCRAVYNSQKQNSWPGTNKPMSKNPVRTAIFWNRYARFLLQNIKDNTFSVKYESLLIHTESVIADISIYLNLKTPINIKTAGTVALTLSQKETELHKNIDSYSIPGRIDAWEGNLSENEITLINGVSKVYLLQLNYDLKYTTTEFWQQLWINTYTFFNIFRLLLKKTIYRIRNLIHGF